MPRLTGIMNYLSAANRNHCQRQLDTVQKRTDSLHCFPNETTKNAAMNINKIRLIADGMLLFSFVHYVHNMHRNEHT